MAGLLEGRSRSHPEARAVFKATCGPNRLENALEVFLDWAEGVEQGGK